MKITPAFFTELEQTILKFVWNQKRPRIAKVMLGDKKNQSWRHHNSRLQAVLQSCNHQDSMVLAKNRHIDQWNKIQNPEINPQFYGQSSTKEVRICNGKKTVSSNGAGKTGQQHAEE